MPTNKDILTNTQDRKDDKVNHPTLVVIRDDIRERQAFLKVGWAFLPSEI
jgi:hypothetical protein